MPRGGGCSAEGGPKVSVHAVAAVLGWVIGAIVGGLILAFRDMIRDEDRKGGG